MLLRLFYDVLSLRLLQVADAYPTLPVESKGDCRCY